MIKCNANRWPSPHSAALRWRLPRLALLLLLATSIFARAEVPSSRDTQVLLGQLETLTSEGRFLEALPIAEQVERLSREIDGTGSSQYALSLSWKAVVLQSVGRQGEAGPLLRKVVEIYSAIAPSGSDAAVAMTNLGHHEHWDRNFERATGLYLESIRILEGLSTPASCLLANSLNSLSYTYPYLGKSAEAEKLLERALSLVKQERDYCQNLHVKILLNLGSAFESRNAFADAEALVSEALAIETRAPRPQLDTMATLYGRLGLLSFRQQRFDEAASRFAIAIRQRRQIAGSPPAPLAANLHDAATTEYARGRIDHAEQLLMEALILREQTFGSNHSDVARTLGDTAWLSLQKKQPEKALTDIRRASSIVSAGHSPGIDAERALYLRHLAICWSIYERHGKQTGDPLAAEAFELAQRAMRRDTGIAAERTARRLAEADPQLRADLRQLGDLDYRLRAAQQRLSEVYSRASTVRSDLDAAAQNDYAAATRARQALQFHLGKSYPDYAKLIDTPPLSLTDVQRVLLRDEVLVMILPTPEGTFVWLVTIDTVTWLLQSITTPELASYVRELRAGLDSTVWTERQQKVPFSEPLAFRLYSRLFEGLHATLERQKDILFATVGPMESLPLHVLVTAPPARPDDRERAAKRVAKTQWFARRHAVTVLPSVASLRGRSQPHPQRASLSYIGFGNPLLTGSPDDREEKRNASIAREFSSCAVVRRSRNPRLARPLAKVRSTGGLIDVEDIKVLSPLPETAVELCESGKSAGASTSDIYLGAKATEATLRKLSDEGELARFRIVQFATHAAVAGEIAENAEPGLVLTPPQTASEADDGYLSRSEVLNLRLDADWVVLSACNTAAPGAAGAEGLSGLAQAFFHAGARSLLVSHWYVDSEATTLLVTTAFDHLKTNPGMGSAEALRKAMVSMLDSASGRYARPMSWAAFVVVGAGNR